MGKKQRLKKERQQAGASKPMNPKASSGWLKWLIGVVLVVLALIIALLVVIRVNQDKLRTFGLSAMTRQVQQELTRNQGKFTINDSKTMRTILNEIEELAGDERLDAVLGGNLGFMVNVLKEIINEGNLKSDELDKMKNLLAETKRRLGINQVNREE